MWDGCRGGVSIMVGYGANTNSDTTKKNIGEIDNKKEIFEEVVPVSRG